MATFQTPQPREALHPLLVMRRELKLLLIELHVLPTELEQLPVTRKEARDREKPLSPQSRTSPKAEIIGDEKRKAFQGWAKPAQPDLAMRLSHFRRLRPAAIATTGCSTQRCLFNLRDLTD